mgnify:CR=1 FL=1
MFLDERTSLTSSFALRFSFSERRLLLRLGDLLLVTASIGGTLWFWFRLNGHPPTLEIVQSQAIWIALVFLGWPIWLFFNDLYNLRWAMQAAHAARIIIFGAIVLTMTYLVIFFITARVPAFEPLAGFVANREPLRLAPVLSIGVSTTILLTWRTGYALLLKDTRRRLIVLGADPSVFSMIQAIDEIHGSQYRFVGVVHDQIRVNEADSAKLPILGRYDQLVQLATQYQVDEIAVATGSQIAGSLVTALMDCHERGIMITPLALIYEQTVGRVAVDHIGNEWYLALPIQQSGMTTLFRVTKRVMDLAIAALLGGLFLLVLPFVAVAIKLDSRGPVFYLQERVGLHGRPFQVIKFRSMIADAEHDGHARWAVKGDSRITRVGAFLRQTRLDELPQVMNVLRGDMSLVGPRPERQQFIEQLQHQIPFYRARLAVKPGLTGWAQINYGYGATVEDALIKLQYDLFYIRHQSPWFDLTIILRTIRVVLRMQGQ